LRARVDVCKNESIQKIVLIAPDFIVYLIGDLRDISGFIVIIAEVEKRQVGRFSDEDALALVDNIP
jgi:hypothetical protein